MGECTGGGIVWGVCVRILGQDCKSLHAAVMIWATLVNTQTDTLRQPLAGYISLPWAERPTGFLQYFDTVALVIWPVKIVPDMTYIVFSGTLNLAQSINQPWAEPADQRSFPRICPGHVPLFQHLRCENAGFAVICTIDREFVTSAKKICEF